MLLPLLPLLLLPFYFPVTDLKIEVLASELHLVLQYNHHV